MLHLIAAIIGTFLGDGYMSSLARHDSRIGFCLTSTMPDNSS